VNDGGMLLSRFLRHGVDDVGLAKIWQHELRVSPFQSGITGRQKGMG
jgi:hypothetical protein